MQDAGFVVFGRWKTYHLTGYVPAVVIVWLESEEPLFCWKFVDIRDVLIQNYILLTAYTKCCPSAMFVTPVFCQRIAIESQKTRGNRSTGPDRGCFYYCSTSAVL